MINEMGLSLAFIPIFDALLATDSLIVSASSQNYRYVR